MITLHDKNATNFNNNGLVVLNNCKSCFISEELNGAYELELEYPYDPRLKWQHILEDNIIKADGQLFRIYRKYKTLSGVRAYARHIFYDLYDNILEDVRPESLNGAGALDWMLSRTQYPHSFTSMSDIDKIATKYFIRKNVVEAIMGDEGFIHTWGGELERDNFTIKILQNRGSDRGVLISYGKNIIGIEENRDMDGVITRVLPVGAEGLTLPEMYIDSPFINNYPHPKIQTVEFSDCSTEAELRTAAQNFFVETGADIPNTNYVVDFIELTGTEQYKNYAVLQRVYMGDTVTVRHSELGTNLKCKVIKVHKNALTNRIEKIELGNFNPNISNTLGKMSNVTSILAGYLKNDKLDPSVLEGAIKTSTDLIISAMGGNCLITGSEILIMDTKDKMTAQKVWRWNINGLGYSSTGVNGEFRTAITSDGRIVADFITAGTFDGRLIKAGTIKAEALDISVVQALNDGSYAKTQLSVLQGQIEQKVSATEVTNAINAIHVGGRNLIRNSRFDQKDKFWKFYEWRNIGSTELLWDLGQYTMLDGGANHTPYIHCLGTGVTGGVLCADKIKLLQGRQYTISYYKSVHRCRASHEHALLDYNGNFVEYPANIADRIVNISGVSEDRHDTEGSAPYFTRVEITFTVPNNVYYILPQVVMQESYGDGYIFLDNFQLEEGNRATAWTPAPEDAESVGAGITFLNKIGVATSGNTIVSDGSIGGWSHGCASTEKIGNGQYVEFTADSAVTDRMGGLSPWDADANYATIHFAWFLDSGGNCVAYESGTQMTFGGTYIAGDVFRVSIENNKVYYYKNGVLAYTSTKTPQLPMMFDSSFVQRGASLQNVKFGSGISEVASKIVTYGTEINQLKDQIVLKASKTVVDNLSSEDYQIKTYGTELFDQRFKTGLNTTYINRYTGVPFEVPPMEHANFTEGINTTRCMLVQGGTFGSGDLIPIDSSKKLFMKTDFCPDAASSIYIGLEQFDINKQAVAENEGAVYIYTAATAPVIGQYNHAEGFIGPQPNTAFVRLRFLINWAGENAKVYIGSLSLKQLSSDAIQARIRKAESDITIQAGQISSKVSADGVKSIIQQSPQDVKYAFNGIDPRVQIDNNGIVVNKGNYRLKEDDGVEYTVNSGTNYLQDSSFECSTILGGEIADATYGDLSYQASLAWKPVGTPKLINRNKGCVPFGEWGVACNINTGWVKQYITLEPGTYTFSTHACSHPKRNAQGASVTAYCEIWNVDPTTKNRNNIIAATSSPITTNHTYGSIDKLIRPSISFTVNSAITIELALFGSPGWVVHDGVQLVKGNYPSLYVSNDDIWSALNGNVVTKEFATNKLALANANESMKATLWIDDTTGQVYLNSPSFLSLNPNGPVILERGLEALRLGGALADHVYSTFYRNNARLGWFGYGSSGTNIMTLYNEVGPIQLAFPNTAGKQFLFDGTGLNGSNIPAEPCMHPNADSFGALGTPSYRFYKGYASGGWLTASDRNLKENINLADNEADYQILKDLNVYSYTFKEKGDLKRGIIAQDAPVEITDENNVDIYGFAALTASALKQAIKEIDTLKSELDLLNNEVAALKGGA